MQEKTNDERLKILQERLAQLKQKKENPNVSKIRQNEEVREEKSNGLEEKTIDVEEPKWGLEEKPKRNNSWTKFLILGLCGGLIGFYLYNNIDTVSSMFSTMNQKEITIPVESFVLTYNFNIAGNHIAIISSFDNEGSAKGMVNDLIVKGFKSNYFFLPDQSNSKEQLYKVFIGPYESLEETSQWTKNIDTEVKVFTL